MSVVSSNKVETNKYEIEISVDAQSFNEELDKAFKKNNPKISIPGFRKGHAPRAMVEKMYGEGVFFEDAINALYPAAYQAAVEELKIEPVDRADIEVTSVSKADGFCFKASVIVKPEVTVKDYKGIAATKKPVTVTDQDVEEEIQRLAERNSRLVDVDDRAAQDGDTVVIDFEGFVEDKAFEGGKGEKYNLTLGSGQFIPGFEEQIAGHNIGDEFDVNVKFPEDYQAEDLAGKDSVFKCKLHEIKVKELPEIDDEFAKDLGDYDDLNALKTSIRERITGSREKASSDDLENQLIDHVIANMEGEIPEVMYEHRIDDMVRDFEYRLQMQNITLDMYMQYTGMEKESFRKTFREQAEKQVKIRLALEKIVELEGLDLTEEELDQEYQKMADQYKMEIDKVKAAVPASELKKDLCVNKAVDLIKESAVVTEEEEKKEEAE